MTMIMQGINGWKFRKVSTKPLSNRAKKDLRMEILETRSKILLNKMNGRRWF